MANQDILYNWWCGNNHPINSEVSILEVSKILEGARGQLNYRGKDKKEISVAGWNYAIMRFILNYCDIIELEKVNFNNKADPISGNYGYWNTRHTVLVKVKNI